MDLVPELFKALTGRSRYEALVGNTQSLAMLLDGAKSLIQGCVPPPDSVYRFAARIEDLLEAHKQAADKLRDFQIRVKTFEADLIAKPWKVD